jgi:hypothetical protein
MKRKSLSRPASTFAAVAAAACSLHAASPAPDAVPATPAAVKATIDASRTFTPINPNLYGMFIEHAGGLVYGSMWAEMLADRKFYYPITSQALATAPTQGRGFGRSGAGALQQITARPNS